MKAGARCFERAGGLFKAGDYFLLGSRGVITIFFIPSHHHASFSQAKSTWKQSASSPALPPFPFLYFFFNSECLPTMQRFLGTDPPPLRVFTFPTLGFSNRSVFRHRYRVSYTSLARSLLLPSGTTSSPHPKLRLQTSRSHQRGRLGLRGAEGDDYTAHTCISTQRAEAPKRAFGVLPLFQSTPSW